MKRAHVGQSFQPKEFLISPMEQPDELKQQIEIARGLVGRRVPIRPHDQWRELAGDGCHR